MGCTHAAHCPLFPYLNASLRGWRDSYCDTASGWRECARFIRSRQGQPVPLALLPNGKMPVSMLPNVSRSQSLEVTHDLEEESAKATAQPAAEASPGQQWPTEPAAAAWADQQNTQQWNHQPVPSAAPQWNQQQPAAWGGQQAAPQWNHQPVPSAAPQWNQQQPTAWADQQNTQQWNHQPVPSAAPQWNQQQPTVWADQQNTQQWNHQPVPSAAPQWNQQAAPQWTNGVERGLFSPAAASAPEATYGQADAPLSEERPSRVRWWTRLMNWLREPA